ncbi:hypothetical protein H310_07784 [Aphanomyces invadans]|uniref:Uncharacterized protein n=1 Tax=Aphanomyces invadans TaxID=157072 RepID=A0A024TZX7_9STRA|nr:hypothetical protein H310_07784 [Aphanomyces invadans]ETV99725.1 hypothetical protein H310_07784 [Aphanomyces invadans]|eukprot:XP_008871501.1 hypothetical protein H310_07784 [Aphanomyces invadans]
MSFVHALRTFVTESLQDADGPMLAHLCDTFQLDSAIFPTKTDVLRSVVDLVVKDRDTPLGRFVAWKQELDAGGSPSTDAVVLAKKDNLTHAFLPIDTTSPRRPNHAVAAPPPGSKRIFDFVLDREMAALGDELMRLEAAYKEAERGLHHGSISYDKIKRFLQTLTQLRANDDQFRILLLEKNQNLRADNARLFKLEAHTREQLELFVDGCARLRGKHDAMVENFSRVGAADAAAHELIMQLYGGECAFTQALTTTLQFKCQRLADTEAALRNAHATINTLETKLEHQQATIDEMHRKWDAAAKDALCAKIQLRRCRKRMRDTDSLAFDARILRGRAMDFQHMVCDLMGMGHVQAAAFQDAKGAFVKSADRTSIAWRALRYLTAVASPTVDGPSSLQHTPSKGPHSIEFSTRDDRPFPAIVMPPKRKRDVRMDLPVVVVLGGGAYISSVVHRLCVQFGYSSLDVEAWRGDTAATPEVSHNGADPGSDTEMGEIPMAHERLAWAIQASGSVLVYNWPRIQPGDVTRLIQHGANVKMVLDLGGADSTTTAALTTSCALYRRLPMNTSPLHVDQIVHDTALVWHAYQDTMYSCIGIKWDAATIVMNERCAMMREELSQRMVVEWGKHLAILAEKKAAADAKAKLQTSTKANSTKRPPSNNRTSTPNQKTKPGTPSRGAAASGRATSGKSKPQPNSASPGKSSTQPSTKSSPVKRSPATPAKKK